MPMIINTLIDHKDRTWEVMRKEDWNFTLQDIETKEEIVVTKDELRQMMMEGTWRRKSFPAREYIFLGMGQEMRSES